MVNTFLNGGQTKFNFFKFTRFFLLFLSSIADLVINLYFSLLVSLFESNFHPFNKFVLAEKIPRSKMANLITCLKDFDMCYYNNNQGGIPFPLPLPCNMVGDEFVYCPRVEHAFGQQQCKTVTITMYMDFEKFHFLKIEVILLVTKGFFCEFFWNYSKCTYVTYIKPKIKL